VRYGGNTPCLDVRVGDGPPIILDAGSGIRRLGRLLAESEDTAPLHLFLTHRHSDHVLGLAHFAPLFMSSREITVCCGDGEGTSLHAFISSLLTPPMFPYVAGITTRLALCEWEQCAGRTLGTARVQRFTARHPGEAAIFRIDDERGATMAFAPDNELSYHDDSAAVTAWRRALVRFLHGVPVLVHDATYRYDELPRFVGWGHSSADEATRLAMECEAGMLVLFHHHPDRDDDALDRMLDEAREQVARAGSPLQVLAAWEGLELRV
jgi:ribonuclease BN (tRNA processing enzyme)